MERGVCRVSLLEREMMQIRPYEAKYSMQPALAIRADRTSTDYFYEIIQLEDIMVWFLTYGLSFHQGNKVFSCKCPVEHSLETVGVTP